MKNFLLMAATCALVAGCSPYSSQSKHYILPDGQTKAQMVLGEARNIKLYNVKESFELTLKAPLNSQIYDAQNQITTDKTIILVNPRDKIAYRFEVKNKEGDIKTLDFILDTYKSKDSRPVNATNIRKTSGKYTTTVGQTLSYQLALKQNATEIDLNEFDNYKKYVFMYEGQSDYLEINILPPKDMKFFIGDKYVDSYRLKLEKNTSKNYNFLLKHKDSETIFYKDLSFKYQYKALTLKP